MSWRNGIFSEKAWPVGFKRAVETAVIGDTKGLRCMTGKLWVSPDIFLDVKSFWEFPVLFKIYLEENVINSNNINKLSYFVTKNLKRLIGNPTIEAKELAAFGLILDRRQFLKAAQFTAIGALVSSIYPRPPGAGSTRCSTSPPRLWASPPATWPRSAKPHSWSPAPNSSRTPSTPSLSCPLPPSTPMY